MIIEDIVVLEEAARDMEDGRHFYEQQEKGIGDYFWDSLISDIESLKLYAGVHQRYSGLYRMPSKRFPYAIYYEVTDAVAYIVAVLPMRRSPLWIDKKVSGRS
ncbi:type II toxin-antitoxin system RelE/ParE family toxin [Leucothrix pacifica]|nr:type II toxin-antitoxin system RelE/ParE family toxin [Leucothrix pacifica]